MRIVEAYDIDVWEIKDDKISNFIDMVINFLSLAYEESLSNECDITDSINNKEVSEDVRKEIREKYPNLYLKLYDALVDILWKLVDDGYLGESKND